LEIQHLYGFPVDIEWAIKDGELFILQARPMTSIRFITSNDWTNAELKDGGISSEITTPFMYSWFERVLETTMPPYLKSVRLHPDYKPKKWFTQFMLYSYWNLSAVKDGVKKLPGFIERDFDNNLGIRPHYEGDGHVTERTLKSVFNGIRIVLALKKSIRTKVKNAPAKLLDLEGREPLYKTGEVRWYEPIKKDSIYVVSLDPSLGTGGDYAAIQIFEANTTRQVGEWRHNRTPIPRQVKILADICEHIHNTVNNVNSIYYSVENNTIGEAVLISIDEWGEENIQGYFLSDNSVVNAGGRRFRKGYNTTPKSKLSACAKLKNLIESSRMTVNSRPLVSELKTFVSSGVSYAAKPGETDDLVMSTVLAVRMLQTLQSYYADLDKHIRDHGEVIEPMPFISVSR
jgi:hypothetical protein